MKKEQWRVDVGNKEKRSRRYYTRAVKPLLKKWIKELGKQKKCPICGEDMPQTFHEHHIDGNRGNKSPKNLIDICGSCHVITYRAKKQLKELWIKRHNKMLGRKNAARKAWISRKK